MGIRIIRKIRNAVRLLNRKRLRSRRAPQRRAYQQWVKEFDTPNAQALVRLGQEVQALAHRPMLSVLMPTYNPKLEWLDAAIQSLQQQVYPCWELCIADDCSTAPNVKPFLQEVCKQDPRIKVDFRQQNGHISACSNTALAMCQGEFVALMDQDDLLPPQALLRVAQCINKTPTVGMIYSNEDKIGPDGLREGPSNKAVWSRTLLLEKNHFSHLGVYKTELMRAVGGFRLGFEGSQDHDLALRCSEKLQDDQIVLLPEVLYHWRMHEDSTASSLDAKPYALEARRKTLAGHIQRS